MKTITLNELTKYGKLSNNFIYSWCSEKESKNIVETIKKPQVPTQTSYARVYEAQARIKKQKYQEELIRSFTKGIYRGTIIDLKSKKFILNKLIKEEVKAIKRRQEEEREIYLQWQKYLDYHFPIKDLEFDQLIEESDPNFEYEEYISYGEYSTSAKLNDFYYFPEGVMGVYVREEKRYYTTNALKYKAA